jgi:hypothetical protein
VRIRVGVPDEHVTPEVVEPVLEAVTRLNEHMIRSGQSPTSHELIAKGARWRPENMGDEHFDHGGTIASRGWGDCDDWAPLHAATLRANGTDPGAKTIMVPSGPNTFHAIVQRSNGSIEDPSVAAGMKAPHAANISGPCIIGFDDYDGRIYQGASLATTGPLALVHGPAVTVRGCHVAGHGALFEGRVDVPIDGSRLVHVRAYSRRPGHHRKACGGVMPYAISVTHHGLSRGAALRGALIGAVIASDASDMAHPLDRYKLMALQSAMAGASPGQVHDALERQIHADLHMQSAHTGLPPEHHAKELLAATPGGMQYLSGPILVGSFFSDIGHIASSIVSDVGKVASSVAKTVGPWVGDILHGVEAAASVVPGLGTAVSDVVAAAESAYDVAAAALSGNPLEGAIKSAYNFALASVPGAAALHPILDPVVNGLIAFTIKKEPIESAVLDGLLTAVPDAPKLGPISPRSVAASLAHLIVGHLGVKNTGRASAPKSTPMTSAQAKVLAAAIAHLPAGKGGPFALANALARAPSVTTRAAPKPPPKPAAPVKVVPMVVHPAAAAAAPHLPALTLRKPTTVPVATASKPLGIAHAAIHSKTMQTVNTMVHAV